ncbi:MAG: CIA30 family protein [Planctomycetota bacterium]
MPLNFHELGRSSLLAAAFAAGSALAADAVDAEDQTQHRDGESLASADRTRLVDFTDAQANRQWRMVNDNVMGGRSLGDVEFIDGVMRFHGSINTNGGGFSSVRLRIEPGTLAGAEAIVMRVKSDGRQPYRLMVMDDQRWRGRLVSHRGELPIDPERIGQWQTVTIDVDDLAPSWRGNSVNADELDPARAFEIGLNLNDTEDGPFELKVDWIDVVRGD